MDRKKDYFSKNILRYNKKFYSKQLNRTIFVLVTLLIILFIKMINHRTTNNIIKIIKKNIYYDFSLKEDGKKVKDSLINTIDSSMEAIEKITGQYYRNGN